MMTASLLHHAVVTPISAPLLVTRARQAGGSCRLHQVAHLVVRDAIDGDSIDTLHGGRRDHSNDDGLFGRLDGRTEQRADVAVGYGVHRIGPRRIVGTAVRGREGYEDVAGAIAGGGAGSRQSHGGTARQALELVGKSRRVGGHYDDDRAEILVRLTV